MTLSPSGQWQKIGPMTSAPQRVTSHLITPNKLSPLLFPWAKQGYWTKLVEFCCPMALLQSLTTRYTCYKTSILPAQFFCHQFCLLNLTLSPSFDILHILRSFPKGISTGPSGISVQHLLDAASVPLHSPICATLRGVVNVLASSKAPKSVSPFLAGARLIALNRKNLRESSALSSLMLDPLLLLKLYAD